MRALGRIQGWMAVLGVSLGMVLGVAQRGQASDGARGALGYDVTAPAAGDTLTAGSTVEITWLGGEPDIRVNVLLIDVDQWAVVQQIALNIIDDGQEYWNIPSNLPPGEYQIYVEDLQQTAWTYGTSFTVN